MQEEFYPQITQITQIYHAEDQVVATLMTGVVVFTL